MEATQNPQDAKYPKRKMRTRTQVFKEDYLPVIIIGIALILAICIIIGSIVRSVQRKRIKNEILQQESIAAQEAQAALEEEAARLLTEAAVYAEAFDYNGAIAVLDRFSGDMYAFSNLSAKYAEYASAANNYELWEDPGEVINLSFHPLIANASLGLSDSFYANNYITVNEFSNILLDLYEKGYVLIRYNDLISNDGNMRIFLPKGKKPLIITETQVNYNTAPGKGFADKLIVDSNGNLSCEMTDNSGNTTTGAYDIVPILEAFIKEHPDFSFRGARAVLALTGYEGLFGYSTNTDAQQADAAKKVIEAVKKAGYELACYSYKNEPYGTLTAAQIKSEMELWKKEVTPLLGDISLFVMCRNSDIAENDVAYTGDKFEVLKSYGFTDFIGFSNSGESWFTPHTDHNRMGRILVSGSILKNNPKWFDGIFDPNAVQDPLRK